MERKCPICNNTIEDDSQFCPFCGVDLTQFENTEEPEKAAEQSDSIAADSDIAELVDAVKEDVAEQQPPARKKKTSVWTIGVTVLLAVAMIVAVGLKYLIKTTSDNPFDKIQLGMSVTQFQEQFGTADSLNEQDGVVILKYVDSKFSGFSGDLNLGFYKDQLYGAQWYKEFEDNTAADAAKEELTKYMTKQYGDMDKTASSDAQGQRVWVDKEKDNLDMFLFFQDNLVVIQFLDYSIIE